MIGRLSKLFALGLVILSVGLMEAWAGPGARELFLRANRRSRDLVVESGNGAVASGETSRPLPIKYAIELTRGSEKPRLVSDKFTFLSGDRMRLIVGPARACNVYVIHKGASGEVSLLYPNPWSPSSRLKGGETVPIPGKSSFRFDHRTGQEGLAIVFSLNAIPKLEEAAKKAARSQPLNPQEQSVASQLSAGSTSRNLILEARQESQGEAQGPVVYAVDLNPTPGEPAVIPLVLIHR